MHTISVWPGLSAIVETVINTPLRPEPAEACCDVDEPTPLADVCGEAPYDELEIGSVERLYPEGRQAELDDVA